MNWDRFFLQVAEKVSTCSKDPSTQVGAVLVDEHKRIVSTGYNGFPKGVNDDPTIYADRAVKHQRILHAEANSLLFAQRQGVALYVTHSPCCQCMAMAIQHGVKKIHWYSTLLQGEWAGSVKAAMALGKEAGLEFEVHYKDINDQNS